MYQGITMHTGLLKAGNTAIHAPGKESKKSELKVSGIKGAEEANSRDTILNISGEARQKYAAHADSAKSIKKAGTASAREIFENYASGLKQNARRGPHGRIVWEIMRLDAPEAYEKMRGLQSQAWEAGNVKHNEKEAIEYSLKAIDVHMEWFYRRCYDKGFWSMAGGTALDTLERIYSDEVHDTSFNFYIKNASSDERSSMWRYDSKFNVLLPADLLKDLASLANMNKYAEETAKTRENCQKQMEKVDRAIGEMKKAELDYEGDLEYLRFGVKLWDNGNVTYHANYKGCENEDGIMADSAQELLEKLMAA